MIPGGNHWLYRKGKNNKPTWFLKGVFKVIWSSLKLQNEKFFPIWGTCLGMESVVSYFAKKDIRKRIYGQ